MEPEMEPAVPCLRRLGGPPVELYAVRWGALYPGDAGYAMAKKKRGDRGGRVEKGGKALRRCQICYEVHTSCSMAKEQPVNRRGEYVPIPSWRDGPRFLGLGRETFIG